MNLDKTVGVIGGLGPMATVYFYNMVVNMTDAEKDQDHIDMIIMNRASTPDRTSFIIGESNTSPLDIMASDVKKLEKCNIDFIVITCNTAHYFYNELQESTNVEILNTIEETVKYAKESNKKKLGILATTGNIQSNLYQEMCKKYDIDYFILSEDLQKDIMSIIYNNIKSGEKADMVKFNKIIYKLKENNCDGVILGCTELSILKKDNNLEDDFYIDSLEVLARTTISKCNKKIKRQ